MYLIIVLGFMVFDVVTGLIKAGYNGNYNSAIMRQGGFHKSMEVMAMAVAYFVTKTLTRPLEEMTDTAKKIKEGDTRLRMKVLKEDEIGILGQNFNEMLDTI